MPNIKQNLDSITVVGFTIYDGKVRPPAGTGPEGSPELHCKVGVGIPVHNGGHVLGECVGNASSDGMKLK